MTVPMTLRSAARPLERHWLVLAVTVLVATAVLTGSGTVLMVAAGVGIWSQLNRIVPWDSAVLLAAGLLVGTAIVIAALGNLAGLPVFRSAALAWMFTIGLLALVIASLRRTKRTGAASQSRTGGTTGIYQAVAFAPVMVPIVGAVLNLLSDKVLFRWIALNTDPASQAWVIRLIRDSGRLSYSTEAYPAGLHALAALGAVLTGSSSDLVPLLREVAVLTWLVYAVLVFALTSLALRLSHPLGPRVAALCGFSTGVSLLVMDSFVSQMVLYAAVTAMLALALLVAPVLLHATDPALWRRLAPGAPLLVALCAHLWTPALIAATVLVSLIWARVLWPSYLRENPIKRQDGVAAAAALAIAVPLTAWPVLGILGSGAADSAGMGGPTFFPARVLFIAVGFAALAAVVGSRRAPLRSTLPLLGALFAMFAYLFASGGNYSTLRQYYPLKAFWMLIAASVPVAFVGLAVAAPAARTQLERLTARLGSRAGVTKLVLYAAIPLALLPVFAVDIWSFQAHQRDVLTPLRTSWSTTESQRTVAVANRWGGAFAPRITIPVLVRYTPTVPRQLPQATVGRLLRLKSGQPLTSGGLPWVCKEVSNANVGTGSVIITAAPVSLVTKTMDKEGCRGAAPVVRITPDGYRVPSR